MAETVQCPGCKKVYAVPEKLRGRTVACKKCGGKVVLPGEAVEVLTAADLIEEEAYELAPPVVTAAPKATLAEVMSKRGVRRDKHSPEVYVDENKSVESLKIFFPEFFACMDFYARYRSQTYTARNVPPHCEVCGQAGSGTYCFTWHGVGVAQESDGSTLALAVASRLVGGHRPNSRWVEHEVTYDTYHTLCDGCWRSHQAQMLVLKQCLWITFVMAYIVCMVAVLIVGLFLPQDSGMYYWIAMAVGLVVAGIFAWGIAKGVRAMVRMFMGCPKNLRVMGGGYFVLQSSAPA